MNYGTDINIFANGLPDFVSGSLPAGSQRLSSKPALDLTLTEISDERLVLLLDLYKMQFTPPEYLFWSRDSQDQPNPITTNIPDLLGDSYDRATFARLGAELETLILADARYAAAQVTLTPRRRRRGACHDLGDGAADGVRQPDRVGGKRDGQPRDAGEGDDLTG